MNFISYAQNYEDVILWRALKHIEKGFYIDIGANDPVIESVSNAFYEKGWRGINIEPATSWFKKLEKIRQEDTNLQIAINNRAGTLRFYEVMGTGLSTIHFDYAKQHAEEYGYEIREYTVPAMPLKDVLSNYNIPEVHFLKIDVEGNEFSVLMGSDFSIFRPWIILVEATKPNSKIEDYSVWEPLLINNNYHYVYFDGLNRFYVANEHDELDPAFELPPNIWDSFKTFKEHTLAEKCQQLETLLQECQLQHDQLEASMQEVLRSHSMRVTAPLRMIRKLVKNLIRLPNK